MWESNQTTTWYLIFPLGNTFLSNQSKLVHLCFWTLFSCAWRRGAQMPRIATLAQIEQYHEDFQNLLLHMPQDLPAPDLTTCNTRESDTHVFARVRPVLPHEAEKGNFRTVFAPQPNKLSVHMLTTTLKGLPAVHSSHFKVGISLRARPMSQLEE